MSKTVANVLKIALSLVLSAIALYFVFRQVDYGKFLEGARNADYKWVAITMFLGTIGYILRAVRWRLQFDPLGYQPGYFRMFLAVMTGYLANLLLPRLGEVARCGTLYRSDRIPVAESFGTVITERVVDMLALMVILGLTFIFQSQQISTFINQRVDVQFNFWMIGIGVLAVLGILAYVFFKWIYPSENKIGKFSRGVVSGLTSLKKVKVSSFLTITVGIWIIYFLMTYLMFFALEETSELGPATALAILSAGVIAFVLPVQSGIGTFHGLVSAMLVLYGIELDTGVLLAVLLHTSQILVILFLGLFAGIISIFVKRNENREENTVKS